MVHHYNYSTLYQQKNNKKMYKIHNIKWQINKEIRILKTVVVTVPYCLVIID